MTVCATVLETRREFETCDHGDVDELGTDGDAEFLRCAKCEHTIVRQGGRLWHIRRSSSAVRPV